MSDDAYSALAEKPALSEKTGETTWYLKDIRTSGPDGKLRFDGLTELQYRLVEFKAPDGYYGAEPQLVTRSDAVVNVTVDNEKGFLIPESGGIGTDFRYIGLAMCAAALTGLFYQFFKKRKGE